MALVLGCIADDLTGASDLANTLVRQGMRTLQLIGVPNHTTEPGDAEAVVVALKSRTAPVADAVAWSRDALAWLRQRGARQFFFKYCSTFDSTDQGNIGPVADALLDTLGARFSIACPAFPANGRTVYRGHLFVGDLLLSDSGMKDHPLTPMRDSNLIRVLGRQTRGRVGLIEHSVVARGAEALAAAFTSLEAAGFRHVVVDAISDADLLTIGEASRNLALITGASGLALGLPENYRRAGLIGKASQPRRPRPRGRRAVLAGSCSLATRAQVEFARARWPSHELDPLTLVESAAAVARILDWAAAQDADTPILITSSADPDVVARVQTELGQATGQRVESAFGRIARGLVEMGVRQLIVAGGETSGAAVAALAIRALRIGPEIDPGVPWCETLGEPPLALALKSGNFGAENFFIKAFEMLS